MQNLYQRQTGKVVDLLPTCDSIDLIVNLGVKVTKYIIAHHSRISYIAKYHGVQYNLDYDERTDFSGAEEYLDKHIHNLVVSYKCYDIA